MGRIDPTAVQVLQERQAARPRWRGRLHQWSAILTPFGAIAFVAHAAPGTARVGAGVFAASAFVLFATSAAYHRIDWSLGGALVMKRADHVAIFVLLAGTYTPVALVLLEGPLRVAVLVGSWGSVLAAIGAASLGWFEKRGVAITAYIVLGWMALLMAPSLIDQVTAPEAVLIVAGGVLYTGGAIGLALRWPDPDPAVFGFHEVWHVYTVAGVLAHAGAIWLITA